MGGTPGNVVAHAVVGTLAGAAGAGGGYAVGMQATSMWMMSGVPLLAMAAAAAGGVGISALPVSGRNLIAVGWSSFWVGFGAGFSAGFSAGLDLDNELILQDFDRMQGLEHPYVQHNELGLPFPEGKCANFAMQVDPELFEVTGFRYVHLCSVPKKESMGISIDKLYDPTCPGLARIKILFNLTRTARKWSLSALYVMGGSEMADAAEDLVKVVDYPLSRKTLPSSVIRNICPGCLYWKANAIIQ
jgi:hypothetical protein